MLIDPRRARGPRAPRLSVALLLGAAASALIAGAALAQAPASPPEAAAVETIVVTGSRIAGVAPVGSNLVSVGRSDVVTSGAVTTSQLLQQVPQVFNLGVSENSRGQSGGSGNITYGNSVNLRGIGPFTTLTIVDGRRATPQGTTGFSVDPSIIPTIALERVEIVADGSSAIYGSDAVAGVVNLIRRRNVQGVEATARYGWADDFFEHQFGIIAGHSWGSGRATLAFENAYRSALNGRDRDFYRGDLRDSGGGDFRPTLCNPGNIIVGGVSYAIPAGGVTAANRGALTANTSNRCDNLKIGDLFPKQKRMSLSATFDQSINDRLSIYADVIASKREFVFRQGAQATTLTVPSSNAFFVAPPGLSPSTVSVGYSFINDYQPFTEGYSKVYQGTLGGRYQLGAGWRLEASATWGRNDDRSTSHNVANAQAQAALLASSNPATALNVFGGPNSSSVINSLLVGRNENPGRSSLGFYDLKLDGPLFTLPGGEVRAAVGYERQDLHVVQNLIAGTIAVPTQNVRVFDRTVDSGYAELLVPVVGEANAMPGIRSLELDLAGRYDRYSDVGGTWNPKIGVNWSPATGVKVRGAYGTSFRAPTISQIYGNTNNLFVQNYADPTCACIRQGVARSGANLNLTPEEATTWSLGVDYEPAFLQRAKFSLTYFDINYKNQVTAYLSDLTVLQREAQFAGTGIIVRNPSPAFIAQQLAETGFTGVLPSPVTLFVEGRNSNLGTTIAKGLDFQATYRLPTSNMGDFAFDLNGTYFTEYKLAITPTAPLLSFNNKIFNPLRLKGRFTTTWTKGPIQLNAFVNYQNAYINNLSTPVQRVKSYTTVDLRGAYRFEGGALNDLIVAVEARNLFDENPPFVNIAQSPNGGGGFDPTLTNPVGRLLAVSVSKRF
jgi:iron complex outermembrane receptor protein